MTEFLQSARIEMSTSQDTLVLQHWEQSPLMNITGIEVFDNMRFEGVSAEERYRYLRKDILSEPYEEPTIISVSGPSGSGKGGFGMAIDRLLIEDLYLRDQAKKKNITIGTYTLPFSLYQQASKLERIRDKYPVFKDYAYSSTEYYRGISTMMWSDIERFILTTEKGHKKVAIIESSSPTSHPVNFSTRPVEVTGVDRGNSVIYTAAIDTRTKSKTFIHALIGDERVREQSQKRRQIMRDPQSVVSLFAEDIMYVFTRKSGEKVDVSTLPDDEKRKLIRFLGKCMAPPEIMPVHEEQMHSLRDQLGLLEKDDVSYYAKLKRDLGYRYNDKHFITLTNEHAYMQKTVDLDYFLYSLPAQLYPEILEGITL